MNANGRHIANRYRWTAFMASLVVTISLGEERVVWKTGTALETQLKQETGIQWQERPLRPALERLAREAAAATFLDRRIDPDQLITLSVPPVPLSQLYEQIATRAQAQSCRVGPITYIGPATTSARLSAVANRRRSAAGKLPADLRTRVLKQSPLQWPELSEPRTLVSQLVREAGLSLSGDNSIPHDLWPAVDLPPLAWTDRLSLVLAGFDLTYEIDLEANALKLTPLPATSVQEPPPRITKPKKSKSPGKSVYTFSPSGQPAGNVLKTIAQSLGKELQYDPGLVEKLRQPVTFDLKNVTLEQLLETTLANSGLSYELTDTELRITESK